MADDSGSETPKKEKEGISEEDAAESHGSGDWMSGDESNFWQYFFHLLDSLEGSCFENEFRYRAQNSYGMSGINWNFWTGPRSSSYTLALKKTIDRIRKVGRFDRYETNKLRQLADKVVRGKRAQIKLSFSASTSSSKFHDADEHTLELWINVRRSLDNQPIDRWTVVNCLCDVFMGLVVAVILGVVVGLIYSQLV